jgi:hypothetical protein
MIFYGPSLFKKPHTFSVGQMLIACKGFCFLNAYKGFASWKLLSFRCPHIGASEKNANP